MAPLMFFDVYLWLIGGSPMFPKNKQTPSALLPIRPYCIASQGEQHFPPSSGESETKRKPPTVGNTYLAIHSNKRKTSQTW